MIHVESIPGKGEGGRIKEKDIGINSSVMHFICFENFCKCCNVTLPNTTVKY
jgi:hypothetical protein